jgi:hypothetical protein
MDRRDGEGRDPWGAAELTGAAVSSRGGMAILSDMAPARWCEQTTGGK